MEGKFSISLAPDTITTLSTSTGQSKGSYGSPPSKPFPIPHNDDFECEHCYTAVFGNDQLL